MRIRNLMVLGCFILGMGHPLLPFFQEGRGDQQRSAAAVLEEVMEGSGPDSAWVKFKELLALKDTEYDFLVTEFLALGTKYLRAEKTLMALEILKMGRDVFPESADVHIRLGYAYRLIGDHERDRRSVRRAFELRDKSRLADYLKKNKGNLARTADDVIERYLAAIGGREKLLKITSLVLTYSAFESIDAKDFLVRSYKYPHLRRQDNLAAGTAMATDGETIWRIKGDAWQAQNNSNWKYMPDIYGDFLGYRERGISYRLQGIESIDQKIHYHLTKSYPDGEERDLYFDVDSGLLRWKRRDFGIGKDFFSFWDYRHHDGILIPHLFIVTMDAGFGRTHGAVLKDVQINAPLEDSLFRKIDKAPTPGAAPNSKHRQD